MAVLLSLAARMRSVISRVESRWMPRRPSLMRMSALRPSRMPPRCTAADLHGRHRDLRSQALDVALLQVRILDAAARRHVDARAPDELADVLGELQPIARELDRVDRRERIHEADDVGRAERGADKLRQVGARAGGAHHLADVVLVPENQKQPDVVLRRLGGRVRSRPDRQRDIVVFARAGRCSGRTGTCGSPARRRLPGARSRRRSATAPARPCDRARRRRRGRARRRSGRRAWVAAGVWPGLPAGLCRRWRLAPGGRRCAGACSTGVADAPSTSQLPNAAVASDERSAGLTKCPLLADLDFPMRMHSTPRLTQVTPARRKLLTTEMVGDIVAEVEMRRFSF